MITINKSLSTPLHKQIFLRFKELIEKGTLKPGDRLPPTRVLAGTLGVNRTTVYLAYEELWSMGYIKSRPGSYSFVRQRTGLAAESAVQRKSLLDWGKLCNPLLNELNERRIASRLKNFGKSCIDFVSLSPDPAILPAEAFRKAMNQVLKKDGRSLLQYGDPRGYQPLREYIADFMNRHSVKICSDEILITYGVQSALSLLLKTLVKPGDSIITESPTYLTAIPLFRLHGAKILTVPVIPSGMDLQALEALLQKNKVSLIYTMPDFQNPAGISTSQAHREYLLRICEKYKTPLVEDGFMEEIKYSPKVVMPVKSMDSGNTVVYLGTFSKFLFPGLRIGWIAADKELISRIATLVYYELLGGNILDQAALNRFCRDGQLEVHLKILHRIYRKRMQVALRSARRFCEGENISFTRPTGGYLLWMRINGTQHSEEKIISKILEKGTAVVPGSFAFADTPPFASFRISIGHCDEAQIEEGFRRIGQALDELKIK